MVLRDMEKKMTFYDNLIGGINIKCPTSAALGLAQIERIDQLFKKEKYLIGILKLLKIVQI